MIMILIQIAAVMLFCWAYLSSLRLISKQIKALTDLSIGTAEEQVSSRDILKMINRCNTDLAFDMIKLKIQIEELKREKNRCQETTKEVRSGLPTHSSEHMACDKAGLC